MASSTLLRRELSGEVLELVGVHDRVDLADVAGSDVDGEQLVLATEPEQRRRPSVDLDPPFDLDRAVAAERTEEGDDLLDARYGPPRGAGLATTVAVGDGVVGQDLSQPI